jgi:hypothetical protein
VSPDLLIARPPSTQPVRPTPILCIKSTTPAMILIVAHHVAPATCTPLDKQTRFFKRNRDKGKTTKMPRFEFKHRQVNDSSQSNQETDHLVSQCLTIAGKEGRCGAIHGGMPSKWRCPCHRRRSVSLVQWWGRNTGTLALKRWVPKTHTLR